MERNIRAKFNRLVELDKTREEATREISKILIYLKDNYGCPYCGTINHWDIYKNDSRGFGIWQFHCSECGFASGNTSSVRILLEWLLLIEEARNKLSDKIKKIAGETTEESTEEK